MSPPQVVRSIADEFSSEPIQEITESVRGGASIGLAFAGVDGPDWRVLGAAWQLAETSGAPFAPALERIAAALQSISDGARKRSVLLAGPKMTATLVMWLPLASVAVSFILGFNPVPVFFSPVGALLLSIGVLLQVVGAKWTARLTAQVERQDRVAGLECELAWVALAGGAPPRLALRRVADAVSEARAEWVQLDSLRAGEPLARALAVATAAGVPASGLLLEVANDERAKTQAALEREAEKLGVRILLPLAACVLPAFIAVGVVPIVVALVGDLFPS
ncbi:type II secretion system F family protein [Leucobacter aridicollis]|nr:type II secretion system F family protein [Leucobacter aridicollis]